MKDLTFLVGQVFVIGEILVVRGTKESRLVKKTTKEEGRLRPVRTNSNPVAVKKKIRSYRG